MTDQEWLLVSRAKEGDAHAFAGLYKQYYKDLYYFALSYLENEAAAEDAVSAGILKAYEKLQDLRKTASFKSWLFKIVASTCMNSLRERKRIMPVDFENFPELHGNETKEVSYETAEWREMLGILTEKERLIITMTIFSGYSSVDTAKILKMRPGTVRSLKSRGIDKLKQALGIDKGR